LHLGGNFSLELQCSLPIMRGRSGVDPGRQYIGQTRPRTLSGDLCGRLITIEAAVINRSESRLIALERRNQAERSKQKASRPAPVPNNDSVPTRKAS